MITRPRPTRLLSSRSRVISPAYQAKDLDVCRKCKGIDPPFIRKDQIRRLRKCNNLAPDGRGDKNNKSPGGAATDPLPKPPNAKNRPQPPAAANNHDSFSMPNALENEPNDTRYPSTSP